MNRHTFRAQPPATTNRDDGPAGSVAGVLAQVRRLGEDLDTWAALVHEEQTPDEPRVEVRVLIDQAEDLRRLAAPGR